MLGERIASIRKQKKLTQDKLAEMANIAREQVSRYEKGKQIPDMPTIVKIADALNVSIDDLIDRNKDASSTEDEDVMEIREALRQNPDMRMLFSASQKATPEQIRAVVAMLKAFEPQEFSE